MAANLAFQMFSAAVTHAFRHRTADELTSMRLTQPRAYKLLQICKYLGIDSPRLWQVMAGIVFARAMHSQPSITDERHAQVPPDPPAPPPESLRRGWGVWTVAAHEARRVAALLLKPDEAFRAVVGVVLVVARAVAAALRAVGPAFLGHVDHRRPITPSPDRQPGRGLAKATAAKPVGSAAVAALGLPRERDRSPRARPSEPLS